MSTSASSRTAGPYLHRLGLLLAGWLLCWGGLAFRQEVLPSTPAAEGWLLAGLFLLPLLALLPLLQLGWHLLRSWGLPSWLRPLASLVYLGMAMVGVLGMVMLLLCLVLRQ